MFSRPVFVVRGTEEHFSRPSNEMHARCVGPLPTEVGRLSSLVKLIANSSRLIGESCAFTASFSHLGHVVRGVNARQNFHRTNSDGTVPTVKAAVAVFVREPPHRCVHYA